MLHLSIIMKISKNVTFMSQIGVHILYKSLFLKLKIGSLLRIEQDWVQIIGDSEGMGSKFLSVAIADKMEGDNATPLLSIIYIQFFASSSLQW